MSEPADHLIEQLDAEYEALISGRIDAIEALGPQRQALAEALSSATFSEEDLAHVRRRAERNDRLFGAAMRGLRQALDALRGPATGEVRLETYTARGTRQSVRVGPARHELRR